MLKIFLSRFKKANNGVAALEFAFVLPFLLVVFFGVYEVTTYITTVRKIDNVVNDIGYILSRGGNIAQNDGSTGCTPGVYCGGRASLQSIFNNALPFLMYPYSYNPANPAQSISTNLRIKFIGLPVFSCPRLP